MLLIELYFYFSWIHRWTSEEWYSFTRLFTFETGKKSGSCKQSDMYSFALVVHELLVPKHKYPWEAVFAGSRPATINALIVQAVIRGERPPVPNFEDIAFCGALEIMKECWVQNADERPTAKQVQDKLLTLVCTL